MTPVEVVLIVLVAVIHGYFLVLEMFLWTKPRGLKTFQLKKEFAEKTKVLAANQGLYNGFLSAGLFWSLIENNYKIASFFLSCVFVAGIYGSISLNKKMVFYIQAVPAFIALILILT